YCAQPNRCNTDLMNPSEHRPGLLPAAAGRKSWKNSIQNLILTSSSLMEFNHDQKCWWHRSRFPYHRGYCPDRPCRNQYGWLVGLAGHHPAAYGPDTLLRAVSPARAQHMSHETEGIVTPTGIDTLHPFA